MSAYDYEFIKKECAKLLAQMESGRLTDGDYMRNLEIMRKYMNDFIEAKKQIEAMKETVHEEADKIRSEQAVQAYRLLCELKNPSEKARKLIEKNVTDTLPYLTKVRHNASIKMVEMFFDSKNAEFQSANNFTIPMWRSMTERFRVVDGQGIAVRQLFEAQIDDFIDQFGFFKTKHEYVPETVQETVCGQYQ